VVVSLSAPEASASSSGAACCCEWEAPAHGAPLWLGCIEGLLLLPGPT
jgi:hypothetical protein